LSQNPALADAHFWTRLAVRIGFHYPEPRTASNSSTSIEYKNSILSHALASPPLIAQRMAIIFDYENVMPGVFYQSSKNADNDVLVAQIWEE
jgi:hypothetical protein